ncbi:MAG: T9SS type A sorting domain-containing protein, partial [Bacteroidota bacterium]
VFNNIQLPDSNVNEPASNGFVKFKIQQSANNPLGTVIENKAGIYFDFNEPVITNTTHHLLGEDFIGSNVVSVQQQKHTVPFMVKVFPNPSGDDVYFEVHSTLSGNYQLELIDALGSQVMMRNLSNFKTTINKGSLPAGVYFYRIGNAQGNSTYGKLIIK